MKENKKGGGEECGGEEENEHVPKENTATALVLPSEGWTRAPELLPTFPQVLSCHLSQSVLVFTTEAALCPWFLTTTCG